MREAEIFLHLCPHQLCKESQDPYVSHARNLMKLLEYQLGAISEWPRALLASPSLQRNSLEGDKASALKINRRNKAFYRDLQNKKAKICLLYTSDAADEERLV